MADGFELVDDKPKGDVVRHPRNKEKDGESEIAKQFLSLILTTVSQRAAAVFSAIFTVAGLASCFWLWLVILQNTTPSNQQLAGATIYCFFVLALEWVRRARS
jgi:hypothetical protein